MNQTAMARPGLILLLLALLLGGCRNEAGAPPLAGASMGGAFTLTDQNGRRVSDTDFAGKYRIVYFGFASCPDVCPVDLQSIGAALRQFERRDPERAQRVQPIFITVDPARDTPEVLRDYVANFHPRLIGLTGSEQEIAEVARKFGIYYSRREPSPGAPADAYLVDHQRMAVLYDPEGAPMVILPHEEGAAGIEAELERWVR